MDEDGILFIFHTIDTFPNVWATRSWVLVNFIRQLGHQRIDRFLFVQSLLPQIILFNLIKIPRTEIVMSGAYPRRTTRSRPGCLASS